MKKTIPMYDEAMPVSEGPIAGHLVITKVVREHVPLTANGSGGSIGNMVDDLLLLAAQNGDEVQSFELEITPEYWTKLRNSVARTL